MTPSPPVALDRLRIPTRPPAPPPEHQPHLLRQPVERADPALPEQRVAATAAWLHGADEPTLLGWLNHLHLLDAPRLLLHDTATEKLPPEDRWMIPLQRLWDVAVERAHGLAAAEERELTPALLAIDELRSAAHSLLDDSGGARHFLDDGAPAPVRAAADPWPRTESWIATTAPLGDIGTLLDCGSNLRLRLLVFARSPQVAVADHLVALWPHLLQAGSLGALQHNPHVTPQSLVRLPDRLLRDLTDCALHRGARHPHSAVLADLTGLCAAHDLRPTAPALATARSQLLSSSVARLRAPGDALLARLPGVADDPQMHARLRGRGSDTTILELAHRSEGAVMRRLVRSLIDRAAAAPALAIWLAHADETRRASITPKLAVRLLQHPDREVRLAAQRLLARRPTTPTR